MLSLLLLLASPAYAELQPAFDLPNQADQLRQLGVPAEQTAAALKSMQDAGLSAEQAQAVLLATNQAARVHGPVPAFDTLIQESLERKLRGAELAAAISLAHAETGQGLDHIRKGSPAEGTGAPPQGSPAGQAPVPQQAPEPLDAPSEPSPEGAQ
jgi:hypothetical protein